VNLVHATDSVMVIEGDSAAWPGTLTPEDLVFTTPQGPLPAGVMNARMILHMGFYHWSLSKRMSKLAEWVHGKITVPIGTYNHGREHFFAVNIPRPVLVKFDHYGPGDVGSWPEELVREVLGLYGAPGITVWDGFMGRGTTAKIAPELGMKFIGIEKMPGNIASALDYLGVPK
jgi:hypothetical protein